MNQKDENSFFQNNLSIDLKGFLMNFSTPKVMGIINLSPDSFYGASRFKSNNELLLKIEQMLEEGADLIDLGAFSSRPGAQLIEENEERKRLMPALELVVKNFPDAFISIDTFRSKIAKDAISTGASLINDISGGTYDPLMFQTISEIQVPYVIMHLRGTPETMMQHTDYENVVTSVYLFFSKQLQKLRSMGVNDVLLDVGFGFGKSIAQNYKLLKELKHFKSLACPLLIGLSRKKMIQKVLQLSTEKALNGTTAAHMIALLNGANLLRVHDVKAAREAIKIHQHYLKQ